MHLGSILCNPRTKIGEDCSIHINTAFVARGTNGECPVIGNNCVIGIGSTILGAYRWYELTELTPNFRTV